MKLCELILKVRDVCGHEGARVRGCGDAGRGYPSLEPMENSASLPQSQFPPAAAGAVLPKEERSGCGMRLCETV